MWDFQFAKALFLYFEILFDPVWQKILIFFILWNPVQGNTLVRKLCLSIPSLLVLQEGSRSLRTSRQPIVTLQAKILEARQGFEESTEFLLQSLAPGHSQEFKGSKGFQLAWSMAPSLCMQKCHGASRKKKGQVNFLLFNNWPNVFLRSILSFPNNCFLVSPSNSGKFLSGSASSLKQV